MVSLKILTRCLLVLLIEGIHSAALAPQDAVSNTKTGLRIVDLRATENYAYVIFQPKSAIPEAGQLVVEIFKGNDLTVAPEVFELTQPFVDLGDKIKERFEQYTIRVVKKGASKDEAPVLMEKFISSPGTPSKPLHPDYVMKDSSKAILHWNAPSNPNGPINRYVISHCYRDIIAIEERNGTTTKETEMQCDPPKETTTNEIEIDVQRLKRYSTTIRACNDIEPEFGSTSANRLCSDPSDAVSPASDYRSSGSSATVAVLIVISVLLSLVIVGYAGYKYYRKNYN